MAINFTTSPSGVSVISPGDFDSGCLAFDGTNLWQATENSGNLILVKYDSAGTFVASYTINVSNWGGTTFCPIWSFGAGILWIGGIATGGADTLAALAKITVTAGVPALTAQIDVAPSGTRTSVNGICDDGTDIYVLAPYGSNLLAITKLTTAGAQVWQTTHSWVTLFSNIVYDGTHIYYTIDHVLYQIDPSTGTAVTSHTNTGTYIGWLVYSTFGTVLWGYDMGPQNIYQLSTTTLAITATIPFTPSTNFPTIAVDSLGNVWFIVTDQSTGQGTLFEYDPTGVTQLGTYSFPVPVSSSLTNTPEFIIAVGTVIWGGIVRSSDTTYALVASIPPPVPGKGIWIDT